MPKWMFPAGIAAIIAAWLIYFSDLAIDIRDMFGDGYWEHMPQLEPWRIQAGAFALFLFPFLALGCVVLHRGLGARWLCAALAFTLCTFCVFLHSSYFFFARAAARRAEAAPAEQAALDGLLAEYSDFKNIFGAGYLGAILLLSAATFIIVITGRSAFPRVFALINPLTGVALSRAVQAFAPQLLDPLSPFLIPAFWFSLMLSLYIGFVLLTGDRAQLGRSRRP